MTDSDADMVAKVAGGNRGGLDALKTDKPPTCFKAFAPERAVYMLVRWYPQLPTGDGRASADRRGRRVAVQGFAALRAAPERRLVTRGSAETALGGPRRRRGAARCPRSFSLHGRRRSSCTTADARAAAGAARTVFPGLAEVPGRSEAPDRGDRVD